MFLSTFEKQLDAKRRIVAPADFRAQITGPFDGVFCFPSIEADCIEGGGQALFSRYQGLIEELEFGDPVRSALETSILGGAVHGPPCSAVGVDCGTFFDQWIHLVGLASLWAAAMLTLVTGWDYLRVGLKHMD